MKRLKSLNIGLPSTQNLTRQQLKKIMGGGGTQTTSPGCDCGCKSDLDCGIFVCSNMVVSAQCGVVTCNIHQCVPK